MMRYDDKDPEDFGESYVTYEIIFGQFDILQIVSVSYYSTFNFNLPELICGFVIRDYAEFRFLHTDVIMELLRLHHLLVNQSGLIRFAAPEDQNAPAKLSTNGHDRDTQERIAGPHLRDHS